MKMCSRCNLVKDESEFHKCKNNKDALVVWCKSCRKDYRKVNKETIKDQQRSYYENNKDKINEYKKEHYKNNKKYYKDYRESNKEKFLLRQYKRLDKKKGLICDLTVDWLKENITGKHCVYCIDETKNLGCDRIDNNKGHTKDNCLPCCVLCNKTRSNNFSHQEMLRIGKVIRQIKMLRISAS